MRKLYIVGAGGFGRETAWLIERINAVSHEWDLEGFIDDNQKLWKQQIGKYKIVGGIEYLASLPGEKWVVCAIGNPKVRELVVKKLDTLSNIQYATLIDPSVILSDSVAIGEGSIICAGTVLTVNISIGKHVHINLITTFLHQVKFHYLPKQMVELFIAEIMH